MWEADVIALQETKLAPHAIAETATTLKEGGYHMAHGRPCLPQEHRKNVVTTQAASEANSGGVAIVAKSDIKLIQTDFQENEAELLRHSTMG